MPINLRFSRLFVPTLTISKISKESLNDIYTKLNNMAARHQSFLVRMDTKNPDKEITN